MPLQQRYWDANLFLGWLNQEPHCFTICDGILNDAAAGKLKIVTSTVTYAEVYWLRGNVTKPEQHEAIRTLFLRSYIMPAELDRLTAELARELLFQFSQSNGLQPKDAIHLATAIRSRVRSGGALDVMDTWDAGLGALTGQLHKVDSLKEKDSGADLIIGVPKGQTPLGLTGSSLSSGPLLLSGTPTEAQSLPDRPSDPHVVPTPQRRDFSGLGPPPSRSKQ